MASQPYGSPEQVTLFPPQTPQISYFKPEFGTPSHPTQASSPPSRDQYVEVYMGDCTVDSIDGTIVAA
jgi:hypothetical protein